MALLVRTPAPHEDESLFGYLVRLTEANGYTSYKTLLRVAGVPKPQVNAISHSLRVGGLAEIVGRHVTSIEQIGYRVETRSGPRFTLLGHAFGRFHSGLLRVNPAKHCPACVRETGYISAFWDLCAAVACPIHRCQPITRCSACNAPVRWLRPGLDRCACDASYPRETPVVDDEGVIALMTLIKARLERRTLNNFDNSVGLPLRWIEKESLSSLLQTIRILGTHYLAVQERAHEDEYAVVKEASKCLADWPHGYWQFLRDLGTNTGHTNPESRGLLRYEPFYSAMFRNRPAKESEFLLDEFKLFRNAAPAELPEDRQTESPTIPPERGAFSRRFRVGPAKTISWSTEDSNVDSTHTVRAVSPRDASRYLGIPVAVLNELRRSGAFATTAPLVASASWDVTDVEVFADRATQIPHLAPSKAGTVELRRVMSRKISVAVKSALVAAVLNAEVSVHGQVGLGFGGLRLDRLGVEAVLDASASEQSRTSSTITEAAARLSLCSTVIPAALDAGLLETIEVNGCTRVTNESIETFAKLYVALVTLARQLKTSPQRLVRLAKKLKIPITVLARSKHRSPQSVIRRVDEGKLVRAEADKRRKTPRRPPVESALESLKAYLAKLGKRHMDLPRRGHAPNMLAIATACGLDRSVLTRYPAVAQVIKSFDDEARQARGILAPRDALGAYLDDLQTRREAVPQWNGRANCLAVARACGFDRDQFYRDDSLRDLVEAACVPKQVGTSP